MTIIPDTIEPYLGWKALSLEQGGELRSPSYPQVWPVRQPLEAICLAGHHDTFRWTTTRTPPKHEEEQNFSFDVGTIHIPHEPPSLELPDGLYWILEPVQTEIVSETCTCGIYAVDDPDEAAYYLGIDDNNVLVQIAMWGRLIRGSDGARGQYAYPQQIVFHQDRLRNRAIQAHSNYGIPVIHNTRPTPNPYVLLPIPSKLPRKYLKLGLPHLIFFMLLAGIMFLTAAAIAMHPIFFVPALVPIFLTIEMIRDWDTLA